MSMRKSRCLATVSENCTNRKAHRDMLKQIMKNVELTANLDGQTYPIVIGPRLIESMHEYIASFTASKRIFLLSDAVFKNGYSADLERSLRSHGFDVTLFFMEGGKANKTIHSALRILDVLESMEFTRDSTLVALGGGIIGDVGGFVAATFFRGMNLVHIPTTITGQVDSAIGGKVAVNHNKTINAIGTYYHPRAIFVDTEFIATLPEREFRSGMGEVVKSALIKDAGFCDYLLANADSILSRTPELLVETVRRTVRIKLDHVESDVREKGMRLYLNYGHTIGQAIEIATDLEHEIYRHGEAVSLGMMAVARLADIHYDDGKDRVSAHRRLLDAFHLPKAIDVRMTTHDASSLQRSIYANLFKDKKRIAAGLRFVLVPEVGRAETVIGVEESAIRAAIASLF